ncbi:hypothetical protein KBC79_02405 [Candidatus Woesebacteria bacterium]|nr:hypothetical protein [Candidatus Woesebacteria bacterium]
MYTLNGAFALQILVNNTPLSEYSHEGDVSVKGEPNQQFTIAVFNHTPLQATVRLIVDGLPVGVGVDSWLGNFQSFELPPRQSLMFTGWQLSEVAQTPFHFWLKPEDFPRPIGNFTPGSVIATFRCDRNVATEESSDERVMKKTVRPDDALSRTVMHSATLYYMTPYSVQFLGPKPEKGQICGLFSGWFKKK